MYNIRFAVRVLTLVTVVLVYTSMAQAQTRTWVSGVGDDANPCSRTAPCKTFAGAISRTAAHGEISVLDPAGFGALTITKSITVNGEGTLAGVLNAGTNGIVVNAATTDTVILRNISVNGTGTGIDGIRVLAAKTVLVDHCWIYGQTSDGIEVAAGATVNLKVLDTLIGDVCADGIHTDTTAGDGVATLSR